jgi:hypothetical protein
VERRNWPDFPGGGRRRLLNLNLVTPSHWRRKSWAAWFGSGGGLRFAGGLQHGGYDTPETLRLLEGVVDIYMPDYKFSDPEPAERYLGAPDYPIVVRAALKEMHRQVGDLVIDDRRGRAGLLVRHLVCLWRGGFRGRVALFGRGNQPRTYTNIMDQYRPCHRARQFDGWSRPFPEEMARCTPRRAGWFYPPGQARMVMSDRASGRGLPWRLALAVVLRLMLVHTPGTRRGGTPTSAALAQGEWPYRDTIESKPPAFSPLRAFTAVHPSVEAIRLECSAGRC